MQTRIRAYLLDALGVGAGVAAVSLVLAFFLQRLLTRRILALAAVARKVAEEGNYGIRAVKESDDEVGLLADAFNSLLAEVQRRQQEAEEAVRVRDEFLSVASHELRTPLTPLKLQIQMLMRMLQRADDPAGYRERAMRDLTLTGRHVHRLEKLVDNLLDVTRITRGKIPLEIERVDLSELVHEAVERMRGELQSAQTEVVVHAPWPVLGSWDRLRLDQVVTNLLSNAVKYGNAQPVTLTVGQRDGLAWLEVRDRGMGIADADKERVFGRFERAVSGRHYGGLGLGLFIARQLLASHGGSIRVESHLGRGSTFTVELPQDFLPR